MNKKLYSIIYSPKIIFAHTGLPIDFENEVLVSHFRQKKKLSHQTTTTVMVKVTQKRSFINKKHIDFHTPLPLQIKQTKYLEFSSGTFCTKPPVRRQRG